ncbi:TonB-dependent receptor [Asticcacaulis sp. 201]|uniref:TonB-dependent receptor n=1 Tax=Asticcacaulis sp. 201 TaxID=3028787 RepID=UPI002916E024|nr:TonB-dependent receptor [Asticcacaulis sp. 201]MDV6329744.1 TonB-dependent receptor [Asticcacaulis sp. 201]
MKYLLTGAAMAPLAFGLAGASQAQDAAVTAEAPVDVVVFGTRAAERQSLDQKHASQVTREVITANDAGKLPDQNVAEVVTRMPGVTVADDQGEGRYVVIRGLDPSLAAVRINGQDAAAPESDTRSVKLDTIPTGLIGSVEVIKNQTAEYDASAIAGAVNVKTLSAFDRKKPFLTARYSAGYFELNEKTSYDADVSAGTRFGPNQAFGIVAALNSSRRPQASDNLQGTDGWKNGVPDDWRLRDYYVIRNRQGAALNFDYKPSDDFHLYARTLFSHFTDMEQRQQFRVNLDGAKITNPVGSTASFAATKAAVRDAKYRFEDEHISTVNLGGEFTVGAGKLEVDVTSSSAIKDDDPRYNFSYQTGKSDVKGTYDLSDVLFTVTPNAAAYDASKYKAKEATLEADHGRETMNQASVDYTLPTTLFGADTVVKTGVKYSERHKRSEVDYRLYSIGGNMLLSDYQSGEAGPINGNVFGPTVDFLKSLAYARANNLLVLQQAKSVADDLGGDYDVREKVTAGFVQATIHSGNLTLTPGLRVEHTAADYAAKAFDENSSFDTPLNSFGKKDYTDLFPSLVGRYDFSGNTLARFAATTAIGRPNYVDLAPRVNINRDDDALDIGNPNLNPLKSVNLDAGFEHYFGRKGMVSVAVFHKSIDDPIFVTGRTANNELINGTVYNGASITQAVNLKSAKVSGVEFNYVMQFDSLPAPFDGLGTSLNVTAQDSSSDGAPGRSGDVRLIYTSDLTGTAELTYEKYGWTARVAYSYRSKYLDTLGETAATDIYTAANGKLDLKLGYAVTRNVQLYVEGKNLNESVWRRTMGGGTQLVENEFYGRTWRVGVAAKF